MSIILPYSKFKKTQSVVQRVKSSKQKFQIWNLIKNLQSRQLPNIKQFKYLLRFLNKKEKWIIKGLSILIIFCFIFLFVRLYFSQTIEIPKNGGEYSEGLVGANQYINPILAPINDVDSDICQLVFSGLLKYNKEQEVIPDLAEKYEISKDQKKYTFFLRKDVLWHDKKKFSADDVIFTIQSIQDSKYKSPLLKNFEGVKIEKKDDYTVQFTLEKPFIPFLSSLVVGIIPSHLWNNIPSNQVNLAIYNLKPIGTGPFQFLSLIKDQRGLIQSYVLKRNSFYYGKKSFLNKIVFKFYPDFNKAISDLKIKKIDGLNYLPKDFLFKELNKTISQKDFIFHALYLPQYMAVFLNQQKNPLLKEKNVREALILALDKQKIIDEALEQGGEIVDAPILKGQIGYNPKIKKYNYDPEKAKQLLDKAGWKLKKENQQKNKKINSKIEVKKTIEDIEKSFFYKKNKELKIVLTTIDQPENIKVTQMIQKFWQNIGIKVDLKIIDSKDIQKEIIESKNYEALFYGNNVGFDPDPYPFWHSSQIQYPGLNLALYSNKQADLLLEEARKISDLKQRELKYLKFQDILTEDLPAIFLYNSTHTFVVDKKIKGITVEQIINPSDRFIDIENWYLKIKRKFK
ncbi:MAG: ABC transporter substrate-binding protein [Candidatus Kuenenbacteria bacterium]